MTRPRKVALLAGGDDHGPTVWSEATQMNTRGSTDVWRLGELGECHGLHMTKGYFRQPRRHAFGDYDLLINLITDADQNPVVLGILEKALKGVRVPVLNPPRRVMKTTREGVAARLDGIDGLLVPRIRKLKSVSETVLRGLEKSGAMRFPAILRNAGTHSGRVVGLLAAPDEAPAAKGGSGEFYLTEFVDFRSADGLYRKYRLFVLGGQPVFRHMIISDRWNVHAADRDRFMMPRPALLEESQALYAEGVDGLPPQVASVARAVAERLGLDFFGFDFGILPDGRLVLFEANATMNFFPVSTDPRLAAMKLCVPPARAAFEQMIRRVLAPVSAPR